MYMQLYEYDVVLIFLLLCVDVDFADALVRFFDGVLVVDTDNNVAICVRFILTSVKVEFLSR